MPHHEIQLRHTETQSDDVAAEVERLDPLYAGEGGTNVSAASHAQQARAARSAASDAPVIQGRFGGPETDSSLVRDAAIDGVAEAPTQLPYADKIQASFGRHDVGGIRAHMGQRTSAATEVMGATAFAAGRDVGFADAPDLHTAAHEAAHVVQQRGGVQLKDGVGEVGDEYEQNADRVADHVVRGESAEELLDSVADASTTTPAGDVVQHDKKKFAAMRARFERPAKKPALPPRAKKKPPLKPRTSRVRKAPPPRKKSAAPANKKLVPPPRTSSLYGNVEARSKKKAPPVPQPKTVEPEPTKQVEEEPLIEEELLEEIEPETNEEAKGRILKGMIGVDYLKTAVDTSEREWKRSQEPDEDVSETVPEAPTSAPARGGGGGGIGGFFRGLANLFKSKSSTSDMEEVLANLPEGTGETETVEQAKPEITHAYEDAKGELDDLKQDLVKNTGRLDHAIATGDYAAQAELCDAKTKVDGSAEEIRGKVEEVHVIHLRDVGVGIAEGDDAMLTAAQARGAIDYRGLKIVGKLGKGGSGASVFTAKYMNMVAVAYKLMSMKNEMSQVQETDGTNELHREEKIMSEFQHANILRSRGKVNRVVSGAATPGYVMEKAAFGSLKDVIDKMKTSNMSTLDRVKVTRYLIRGGFRGLKALHDKDYVHSDVKHENFLLGQDMKVKMMDFGKTHKSNETRDGEYAGDAKSGTPEFMAPEVAAGATPEKESDIWSLGETLLYGVFDWDSIDFLSNERVTKSFGKETRRPGMSDEDWQKNFRTKANTQLKVGTLRTQLINFVQSAMTKNPKGRLTADAAIAHPFLVLSGEDETDALKLLGTLT